MIKKFKQFNNLIKSNLPYLNSNKVNESFSQSKEYEDLLKNETIDDDTFLDSLLSVKDINNTEVKLHKNLFSKNGNIPNTIKENGDYKIRYVVSVTYKLGDSMDIDEFDNIIEQLKTINLSVIEMIDRCKSTDKELKLITKKIIPRRGSYSYIIVFDRKIDTKKINMYYNQWLDFNDKEYVDGIKELENIYKDNNIDLSKHIDINDEGNLLQIGFFSEMDQELYFIAWYNKETKQFEIDYEELNLTTNGNDYNNDMMRAGLYERLNDETYLSAADRLEKNHPKRAKKLRKFVDYKQSVDINYIDPRPLVGSNGNIYYIIDVHVQPETAFSNRITKGNGNDIIVTIESVNDIYTLHISNFYTDSGASGMEYSIMNWGTPWGTPSYTSKSKEVIINFPTNFYFSDRKSAKVFKEIVEKEAGEDLLCSINDLYKS